MFIERGSTSRGHLNRLRRRASRHRHAKEAGQSFDLIASDSEHDSDHYSDDDEIPDHPPEESSYDPELVSEERTEWLSEYRASFGLNFGAVGGVRFVLSCHH